MKHYKLKKDLPFAKKGELLKRVDKLDYECDRPNNEDVMRKIQGDDISCSVIYFDTNIVVQIPNSRLSEWIEVESQEDILYSGNGVKILSDDEIDGQHKITISIKK